MFNFLGFHQNGSVVKVIFRGQFFCLLTLLIQALTVSPLTSISHAPQLPVKQPVGISIPTFSAIENQSSPSLADVSMLFGQMILICDLFNLKVKKY